MPKDLDGQVAVVIGEWSNRWKRVIALDGIEPIPVQRLTKREEPLRAPTPTALVVGEAAAEKIPEPEPEPEPDILEELGHSLDDVLDSLVAEGVDRSKRADLFQGLLHRDEQDRWYVRVRDVDYPIRGEVLEQFENREAQIAGFWVLAPDSPHIEEPVLLNVNVEEELDMGLRLSLKTCTFCGIPMTRVKSSRWISRMQST